ncbi:MAG TPA: gephyrin-like molybdotransferase Glp [Anaerolineales bacterium]|nr:gephyrin-like molybdotransferase Glp [Anaerolineales bacterium]
MNLLSVAEARERILTHFQPVEAEYLPLDRCAQRVLSADVAAATDLPLFDNSSMDGFAVRAADVANAAPDSPRTLRVVADIPAGSQPTVFLAPGQAARIMTGAPLPQGADAVVPVEDTDFQNREAGLPAPEQVKIFQSVKVGDSTRSRGMDVHAGEVVLRAGRVLNAPELGLLAMLGEARVPVYRKPRVALLSSGDELIPVDAPLAPGKIHDSNSYMLSALLESANVDVIHLGVAADQRESVEALLEKAIEQKADLILTSAGVSVGAFDFVKEVIESNGKMDFWRVNMRPGKPLAFGEYRGVKFIGLPGNPVSAFVGFEVFVRPALGRLSGSGAASRPTVRVRLGEDVESDGRESYLRAEVRQENGVLTAYLSGHQGSANLLALTRANALLIIPAGVKSAPANREVDAWML